MPLFDELKRRNVFRVGAAYAVAAWIILQLTDVVGEILELPAWGGKLILALVVIGFFLALIFAWAFELTPEGVKRESEVDRSQSVTPRTGRKLDRVIIGLMALGLAYFVWESRFMDRGAAEAELDPGPAMTTDGRAGKGEAPPQSAAEALTAGLNSIAVLPFANRSREQDDAFFADGIHDDLLTQLAKIDGLQVISRTSVMEYRDTTKKIPDIAAELGVGKILEGGVQRAGKRIRINAQLIDVSSDQHLWAETFDREMTIENIFEIQSEITRQIVQAVRGELTVEEQASIAQMPTDNLEAYEAFLRARAATTLADYGRSKYEEAEPWARRAVALDPDFAKAWALLTEIHGQAIWLGYDSSLTRVQEARDALTRARTLAPEDPDVIAAEADQLYRIDNDYPAALRLYQRAHELAPGDARILMFRGITERRLGRWEESVASLEQASALDPANGFIVVQIGDTLARMQEFERLDAYLEDWLQRFPRSRDLQILKVRQLVYQHGELGKARELLDLIPPVPNTGYFVIAAELPRLERDWERWRAQWEEPMINGALRFNSPQLRKLHLGKAYLYEGATELGLDLLRQFADGTTVEGESSNINRSFMAAFLAEAHALLGETDRALELSDLAVTLMPRENDHLFGGTVDNERTRLLALVGRREEALGRIRETLGAYQGLNYWQLRLDPDWDFMREEPQFLALLAESDSGAKGSTANP